MNRETVRKGKELLDEIDELKRYKNIEANSKINPIHHFEFVEHYGEDAKKIKIDSRHNDRIINLVEKIISELEHELNDLK